MRKLAPILIIVFVLLLAIGFSTFYASMTVNNAAAYVVPYADIRVSGFSQSSTENSGSSSGNHHTLNNLYSNLVLGSSTAKVTYAVEITNVGQVEMGILSITGLPNNVKMTTTSYNVGDKICAPNRCANGAVATFYITLEYNDPSQYNANNNSFNINLTVTFSEAYDITYTGLNSTAGLTTSILSGGSKVIEFDSTTGIPTSVSVTGATNSYSSPYLTLSNPTTDVDVGCTVSSGGGVSPAAQTVINNTSEGGDIDVTPVSSTVPEMLPADSSGNQTGYDGSGHYYLLSDEYLGMYKSGNATNSTFEKENLEWEIWDKTATKLTLISKTPTTSKLSLLRNIGYDNGIYFMNKICEELYGGGGTITGVTARNFRMTDIEAKAMKTIQSYNNTSFIDASGDAVLSESNLLVFRRIFDSAYATTEFTASSNSKNVPIVYGRSNTVDFYANPSERILEEVKASGVTDIPFHSTNDTNGTMTRTTFKSTKLFYTPTNLLTTTYLPQANINMVKTSGSYWLASRIIGGTKTNATYSFGFKIYDGSALANAFVTSSGTNNTTVQTYSLRPVIEVDLTTASVSLDNNGNLIFN